MDEKSMIDDLVAQLDAGFSGEKAVGHFNVDVDEENDSTKEVQTAWMYRLFQNALSVQCSNTAPRVR